MKPTLFKYTFHGRSLASSMRLSTTFFRILTLSVFLSLFSSDFNVVSGQCTTTVPNNSYIINMGITPQTYNNGLRPYGMIYDLITNYSVPILWCISPTKVKDGPDFTYNAIAYSGGTFVIPSQYINAAVATRITFWQGQGVVGAYANLGAFVPPIYDTLTSFPKVMIDNGSGNQNIITGYYSNASVPSSAYVLGIPSNLSGCIDIWTNPHDDPTWASHGYLYNFVTALKGNIWAECHEVSVMENAKNSVSPFQQLNFLSTTGLQCYNNGKCGTAVAHAGNPALPATHHFPSEPIMQFMGAMTTATQNGSEKWYIPLAGGTWNPTTVRGVTTSNGSVPSEGALLVYGPAYGNSANGMVMYEAGHNIDNSGTVAERVAAQRAYFNFLLVTGKQKKLVVSTTLPATLNNSASYSLSASVTSGIGPYTYQWSSLMGGTFLNGNTANPTYTAPNLVVDTIEQIKIKVTDACGRSNFQIICIPLLAAPLPIELISFAASVVDKSVNTQWSTASETNNDYFNLERSSNGIDFEVVGFVKGSGNSTIQRDYFYNDRYPLKGISYYRLKQTDYDGQFTYSDIVPVKVSSKGIWVFPNPANGKLFLIANQFEREKMKVELLDISGRVVLSNEYEQSDESPIEIDISDLGKGVYCLVCKSVSNTFSERIIVR